MTERERERNISYEIYQKALRFRTQRFTTLVNSKIQTKAEEVKPMWNGHGNTWYLVRRDMGFDTRCVGMFIEEIAPGKTNTMHRHFNEATVYILSSKGHTLLDEDVVEWRAGDAVFVPPMRWHEFYNDGDETMRFIGMGGSEVLNGLGLSLHQHVDMVAPEDRPHFGKRPSVSVSTGRVGGEVKPINPEKDSQGVYERDRDYERTLVDHRMKTKILASGKDVQPRWNGHSWTHYLVDWSLGFAAYAHQVFIEELPPGESTVEYRHLYEEAAYVLEGRGHTVIDGKRYDWKAGDALYLPPFWWNQSFNDDHGHKSRWLVVNNSPLIKSLGYSPIEHRVASS